MAYQTNEQDIYYPLDVCGKREEKVEEGAI
jgi:hypothetical protein